MMRNIMIRKIKFWFQRRIRGWSDNDCYSMDYAFTKWLRDHLRVYKRDATKRVDFSKEKIKYKGKMHTIPELIDKLIMLTEEYDKDVIMGSRDIVKTKNEMIKLFDLLFLRLWW